VYPTFHLGPIDLPAYFTLLMVGFMVAIYIGWRESLRVGIDPDKMLDLALYMLIFGIIGARILHVIADGYFMDYVHLCTDPLQVGGRPLPGGAKCLKDSMCVERNLGDLCDVATGLCHPGQDCLRVFKIWYGGLSYYGGFIMAVVFGFWFIARHKMGTWKTADMGGPSIALGLTFGRIGCLLAGCCFGKTCAYEPLAIHFRKFSPAWDKQVELGIITRSAAETAGVHATQIYSALSNFLIFAFLHFYLRKRKRFEGQVWWMFVLLYAISRFVIEYFRSDNRGEWFNEMISTSQLIGIPFIVLSIFMMWRLSRKSSHSIPEQG